MRHLSRALRLVIIGALFAGLAIVAEIPAAGADPGPLQVLAPTGPFHVGTVSREVPDPSRGVPTMIQLFYPTSASAGAAAPYMPKETADLAAQQLQLPPQLLESIVTGAFEAPEPAAGRRPIILFSPGLQELRSDDTALVEELASRGFIVVAIDHPYESAIVELPDGQLILSRFQDSSDPATSAQLRAAAVQARVGDIRAVLRALPAIDAQGLLRGRLDLGKIGMFGFSLGGAATAEAMRDLPQIRAGIDLDGSLYGKSLSMPLTRPFLFLARDGHGNASDPSWASDWNTLKGFRRQLHLVGAGHGDFSDEASFLHQLDPQTTDPTGYYGPIDPDRATAATRLVLDAFFQRFLTGQSAGTEVLDNPQAIDPDLQLLQ
jgi:dienelactone hydrolase